MLPNKRGLRTRVICGTAAYGLHLCLFLGLVRHLEDAIDLVHIPAPGRNALIRLISEPRKSSYADSTYTD